MSCDNSNLGWIGINTFLYVLDISQSPVVWVKMSKIDNHDGPNQTTDKVEVTTHDTVDGFKQYLANLSDSGSMNEAMVWDPSDTTHVSVADLYASFDTAFRDKKIRKWKLVFPTSPVYGGIFCGFVDGYKNMSPVKDALRAQVSIKITGGVNRTTGSPLTSVAP